MSQNSKNLRNLRNLPQSGDVFFLNTDSTYRTRLKVYGICDVYYPFYLVDPWSFSFLDKSLMTYGGMALNSSECTNAQASFSPFI